MDKRAGLVALPANPIWTAFKSFGADEFVALVVNFASTTLLAYFLTTALGRSFLSWTGLGAAVLLSSVGPIVEKIGFFPRHFYKAREDYRTTPAAKRKKFGFYFREALKGGSKSLLEDLIIHDPTYVAFMYLGLVFFSDTPAFILCLLSFGLAVVIVAFLEVGFKEFLHWISKLKLKQKGFEVESYYEARFCYSKEEDARAVFAALVEEYRLGKLGDGGSFREGETILMEYHDKYYSVAPWWNGRKCQLRARERSSGRGKKIRTWQIVFTHVGEAWARELDQYRYFVSKKEKVYYRVPEWCAGMIWRPVDLSDLEVQKAVRSFIEDNKAEPVDITFERLMAQHRESLLVSFDRIPERGLFIVEIKARPEKKRFLKEAMRYAMSQGGLQATGGKYHLVAG